MREQMRKRRKELGLTQAQVAEAVGMKRPHYTRIELGTSNPSLKVGLEIKKVLQTADDSIFDNEDEETKETEYG